jgi:hypothetical protein
VGRWGWRACDRAARDVCSRVPDRAVPNLPSRDLAVTSAFDNAFGFVELHRDGNCLVLRRGDLQLELFLKEDLDPRHHDFACCLRVADLIKRPSVPVFVSRRFSSREPPRPRSAVSRLSGTELRCALSEFTASGEQRSRPRSSKISWWRGAARR